RGTLGTARFAPDGQTIVYGAEWDGQPSEIFSTRTNGVESRPLDLASSALLSVSSQGELAVLVRSEIYRPFIIRGVLARVFLAGGAPREVVEDVQWADWSPDGTQLAIVRDRRQHNMLEYPVGTVLDSTEGWFGDPRVSRDGKRVAYIEHPMRDD